MSDIPNLKELLRAFTTIYNFSFGDHQVNDAIDKIAHGDLCRYTKDLADALVCFRNRIQSGKKYINIELLKLEHITSDTNLMQQLTSDEVSELKKALNTYATEYKNLLSFIEEHDFNHL